MTTTSFATLAQRVFNTYIHNSQQGGKIMKKLLKGSLLFAALGISTPVYANGPVTIPSANILGVGTSIVNGIRTTVLILNGALNTMPGGSITSLAACSGGNRVHVLPAEPIHARAFVLLNSAIVMRGRLGVWVQCQTPVAGGSTIPVAITVDMLL